MKNRYYWFLVAIMSVATCHVRSQVQFIAQAKPADRLPRFWQYCLQERISNKDSAWTRHFLEQVVRTADSLGDARLKLYAQYSIRCWRIIFSDDYRKNFAPGDYASAAGILSSTAAWAEKQHAPDIAASCEHFTGQIYFMANRYRPAFEHLLKAGESFGKFGYENVPNAAGYLVTEGIDFYQFEEYDKALEKFLHATRYPFYVNRMELNTLNSIGLIYARKEEHDKARMFFGEVIRKAQHLNDSAWIGIGSGNLGNVLLTEHKPDSALICHLRNYRINSAIVDGAPEDAAKSALSIAAAYLYKGESDTALYYAAAAKKLAERSITDSTESLDFSRRLTRIMIDFHKQQGDYRKALQLTDSLSVADQKMRTLLDNKILSRAIERTDAFSYNIRLDMLKSQKNMAQLRLLLIVIVLLAVLLLSLVIGRARWLQEKRQKQLAEKDKQILVAEKLRAEDGLRHSKELLNAYIDTIREKTTLIGQLESELTDRKRPVPEQARFEAITTSAKEKLLQSTILTEQEWQSFRSLFEEVYPGFSYRLKEKYPKLSPAEARFFYLMRLSLSSREMAAMLGISVEAIHKLRYRLRKKLQLEDIDFDSVVSKLN